MQKFVVIMAGGVGSRFWPRSRKKSPKQLLNIFGQNTMIQNTVDRLDGFVEKDHIYIITNKVQKAIVEEQLPEIPSANIIAEPEGRNTAPCVGLAASIISQKVEDAVIITLPADHLIEQKEKFVDSLQKGCEFAYKSKGLVTFGITPTRPETGYGYINFNRNEVSGGIHEVIKFVEKPDIEKAELYLESGEYVWNSGMFIWRADTILKEMKDYLPEMISGLESITQSEDQFEENLKAIFPRLESISIDYGIMEKSDKVYLLRGEFDWNDVGSWESVYELSEKSENGNVKIGDVFTEKCNNSYVFSPNKFSAVIGADDFIIINTDDALLVCKRGQTQDVKNVVNYLNDSNRNNLV
ncbi:MAG: NTP transferase domain-containing protein [Melioribacteraceae bacterium]|nr:NTP transferase domain-containing protein [Melioribacteraceae bacterium]MCF8265480.1 NTP transferase domain-containing protein [Melioribacteraceae bacterium]MCF8412735.1 NTP transferase domain-containing protein [Melioribacteraceae bacterium]MCF8431101.1 NTP transferase domain-containing protein [Melioribacteraceae bacterium]